MERNSSQTFWIPKNLIIQQLLPLEHINLLFTRAAEIILEKYRSDMTAADHRRSRRTVGQLKRRQLFHMLPGLARLVLPGYDPAKVKITPKIAKTLAFFAKTGPLTTIFSDTQCELPDAV